MSMMASQITSLTIVYSTVHSGTAQRKHQSSASLAFVGGIHRWPVNSLHKGPVTRTMFPFDDIMFTYCLHGGHADDLRTFWRFSHTILTRSCHTFRCDCGIIGTNDALLSIRPSGSYFSEISFEIRKFSFKKMHLKCRLQKWLPSCLGLNVLSTLY